MRDILRICGGDHRLPRQRSPLLLLVMSFLLLPQWVFAQVGGGAPRLESPLQLIRVFDGDSAVLRLSSGETVKIRMAAIDAPEKAQPHAAASRKRFEELLKTRGLKGRAIKKDGFGRWIVTMDVGGRDMGQTLIQEGHAWYYRRYRSDLPAPLRTAYEEAQAVAKEERRGLWADADPLPPWQYRSKQRRREREG